MEMLNSKHTNIILHTYIKKTLRRPSVFKNSPYYSVYKTGDSNLDNDSLKRIKRERLLYTSKVSS